MAKHLQVSQEPNGQATVTSTTSVHSKPETRYTGPVTDARGGGCPFCGQTDGYRNIGKDHWGSCARHKVKWCIGSKLFSSWAEETPDVWERNARELAEYRRVEPILPPEAQERLRQAKAFLCQYLAAQQAVFEDIIEGIGPSEKYGGG